MRLKRFLHRKTGAQERCESIRCRNSGQTGKSNQSERLTKSGVLKNLLRRWNTEEVITSYEGTDVELEVNALAPQDRQILFGQLYENGFLVKTSDDKAPEVAVGWRERKLNGKYDFKWLYAGKFAEGISEEASTKEGKLSPTTKSIKGSFYERSLDNAYEVSVDESNLVSERDTKAAEAIKAWFSKVQEKRTV